MPPLSTILNTLVGLARSAVHIAHEPVLLLTGVRGSIIDQSRTMSHGFLEAAFEGHDVTRLYYTA